jgi:hypothetical protein
MKEIHTCRVVVTTLQRKNGPNEAGVQLLIRTKGKKAYDFAVPLPVADELKLNLGRALAEAAAQYARNNPAK